MLVTLTAVCCLRLLSGHLPC